MFEINIMQLKTELGKFEAEFFYREIKRIKDTTGKKKDIMGHTKSKFRFGIIFDAKGEAYLTGADDKIHIPQSSKIFKTETGSFIIKKIDGMIFLNLK